MKVVMKGIRKKMQGSLVSEKVIQFLLLLYSNTLKCPCNIDPLTPQVYIVKLGFTRVYIIFLFLL